MNERVTKIMESKKDKTMVLGRREFPRLKFHVPVRFGSWESQSQDSLTKDLGGGGVRVVSREFLPIHTKVKLEFSLNRASELLRAVGKVVWVHKLPYSYQHDVGIQFLDIPEMTKREISRFVEQNLVVQSSSAKKQDSYKDFPYTIALEA